MKPRKTSSQLATPPGAQDPSWPFAAANAGMRRRLVAWLLDRLIVVAPLSVVVAAANALDLQRSSAGIALLTAAVMLVNWTYWIYCWSQMRASLGQLLLGLRVDQIGEDRGPTVAEAARRWAALEAPFALLLSSPLARCGTWLLFWSACGPWLFSPRPWTMRGDADSTTASPARTSSAIRFPDAARGRLAQLVRKPEAFANRSNDLENRPARRRLDRPAQLRLLFRL